MLEAQKDLEGCRERPTEVGRIMEGVCWGVKSAALWQVKGKYLNGLLMDTALLCS